MTGMRRAGGNEIRGVCFRAPVRVWCAPGIDFRGWGIKMILQLQSGLLRWAAAGLAVLGLVLVVANAIFNGFNQKFQEEVAQRQQVISNRVEIQRIGEVLVHSLAATAASSRDAQLIAVMTKHGLPAPGPAPAPAGRGK
jgi:hypothetical protein